MKQVFYDPCNILILDPTSIACKNVTPHCSQILEILNFFKQANAAFESIENNTVNILKERGITDEIETFEDEVQNILTEILGEDKELLFSRILGVKHCGECFSKNLQN